MNNLRFLFVTLLMVSGAMAFSQQSEKLISDSNIIKESAIILEEDNSIEIIGQKVDYILFYVSKKMKVKILTEEGLEQFSLFSLPEAFDPTFIGHFPEARNYTDALSELFIRRFRVKIMAQDGSYRKPILVDTIEMVRSVDPNTDFFADYEKPHIGITNLKVGDVLEVDYKYELRYGVNMLDLSSFRVFFNGDVPKEKYHLKISHNEKLQTDIVMENMEQDSGKVVDGYRVYEWTKTNLSGCIDEIGSRPYLELPHVVFSVKPYELLYEYYYSFEERFVPFYAIYAEVRERNHVSILRDIHQGINTKQYSQVNRFIRTQTEGIENDSLGLEKLKKVHHTIVDDFVFDPDIKYFEKLDPRRDRFGDYISKKSIRDISRYDVYVSLILKLELSYLSAYVCDIRTGNISNTYFAPMKENDYLLAVVLDNNTVQFINPKRSRFGYYLNEMPFYYEGSKARLVSLADYRNYKDFIAESNRQITIPRSPLKDNQRRTNSAVSINLESSHVEFETRVHLSGQYSTMSRGLYLYDVKDETVNELYNKKVWDLHKGIEHSKPEVMIQDKEAPFNTKVSVKYNSDQLISNSGDTTIFDLSHLFNHIVYKDIDEDNRKLDYYSDFLCQDSYVYFLKFDKDITLIPEFESVDLKNSFGELKISVEQLGPRNLKVSSNFIVKKGHVKAEDIHDVETIYSKVEELNHYQLKFLINK
ncbi:DUF3857 domain-containing protein [Lentimicrobium sp. S6]|uniref:DUF3857 domain-containing protein n=1 Tax=Lentimicrobium sp. S6 TaxID=2735872 RepID=UPI00155576C7|nr:DUF3857 domain-containing protein [Lentimicrobium sp. S6]NPD45799.1 DUF3857 domain-containing protein [Lentimicrobium sp. S6]